MKLLTFKVFYPLKALVICIKQRLDTTKSMVPTWLLDYNFLMEEVLARWLYIICWSPISVWSFHVFGASGFDPDQNYTLQRAGVNAPRGHWEQTEIWWPKPGGLRHILTRCYTVQRKCISLSESHILKRKHVWGTCVIAHPIKYISIFTSTK